MHSFEYVKNRTVHEVKESEREPKESIIVQHAFQINKPELQGLR